MLHVQVSADDVYYMVWFNPLAETVACVRCYPDRAVVSVCLLTRTHGSRFSSAVLMNRTHYDLAQRTPSCSAPCSLDVARSDTSPYLYLAAAEIPGDPLASIYVKLLLRPRNGMYLAIFLAPWVILLAVNVLLAAICIRVREGCRPPSFAASVTVPLIDSPPTYDAVSKAVSVA